MPKRFRGVLLLYEHTRKITTSLRGNVKPENINWAYKNNQHSEAIAYAEQRHRIQLDVAYSPVSPVTQQQSDQTTLGHQEDNGPTERISTQEIVDAVNDAFNVEDQGTPSSIETNDTVQQDHVEIISINSTPEEDRSHEIISINSTPEQPINSADDNRVSRTTSLELSIYHSVV